MKGLTIKDVDKDKQNEIVLATGFPNALVNIFEKIKNENKFQKTVIGKIADLFKLEKAEFNSMATEVTGINRDGKNKIVVVGSTTYPEKKIGREGADTGYVVVYKKNGTSWDAEVINTQNILALDTKK